RRILLDHARLRQGCDRERASLLRPPERRAAESTAGRRSYREDPRGDGRREGEGRQGGQKTADQGDEGDVVRGIPLDVLRGRPLDPRRSGRADERPAREEA